MWDVDGTSVCGGAVSGNRLPDPIPPRVRPHASSAQIPHRLRGVPGSMHEHRPVTQWLLPRTAGFHRNTDTAAQVCASPQRAAVPLGALMAVRPSAVTPVSETHPTATRSGSASDRQLEHALNPGKPHPREPRREPAVSVPRTAPQPVPEADEIPPHPTDTATDVVRWAAFSCVLVPVVLVWYGTSLMRRDGRGPRPRGGHRRLPRPPAPVRTRRGPGGGRPFDGRRSHPRARPAWTLRLRGAQGRTELRPEYAGRLTGFRAHPRIFSANFGYLHVPWSNTPPPPVRPALKGVQGPRAPYVDRPRGRGALPCTAHECNAS